MSTVSTVIARCYLHLRWYFFARSQQSSTDKSQSQLESAAAEFSAKLQKQRPSTPAAHLDTSFNSLTEGKTYHVPPCDEQSLEDYPLDTSNINVAVANSYASSGHGAAQEPSLPGDAEPGVYIIPKI